METANLVVWGMTASVTGLAAVVGFIGRMVLAKLDNLEHMVTTELRSLDVRLSVAEVEIAAIKRMVK